MTRPQYEVQVTLINGDIYTLTRTVKSPDETGRLVERAAKLNEFLAASNTNGPAYINARHVVALCYYETGARAQ